MKECTCNVLFKNFTWKNLKLLSEKELPKLPGVYAIRIIKRGKPINEVKETFLSIIEKTSWKGLKEYVENRLNRLNRINECPIIYIGSTANLQSRFKDLCGRRHTAFFPIFALLIANWELEIGWQKLDNKNKAKETEKNLKEKYEKIHGKLPALVKDYR